MANNPIAIGFEWRQAFDFPTGFLQPGDDVRAEFRRHASDAQALAVVSAGTGTTIEGDRVFVTLTEDQTLTLKGKSSAVTNFVVVRGQDEIPIGSIVTIPVVLLPTRPLP